MFFLPLLQPSLCFCQSSVFRNAQARLRQEVVHDMGSIASACSSALNRPLSEQLQILLSMEATVIALLAVTMVVASTVLFKAFRLSQSERSLDWRLLVPFCTTTFIGCSLGCICRYFNLIGLTSNYNALYLQTQTGSCATYAELNSMLFDAFVLLIAFYPTSVCALVFCMLCVADRLLRFNSASPSDSFLRWQNFVLFLVAAASCVMVASGISSAIFFSIGARDWAYVASMYSNSTDACSSSDPHIAVAVGNINKAFDIRSFVLWCEAAILAMLVAVFSVATHICRSRLALLYGLVSDSQALIVRQASLRISRTFISVFVCIIGRFSFSATFATSSSLGPYSPDCNVCGDCQSKFFMLSQYLFLSPQIQVCRAQCMCM
jgi:hypothetical protein